VKQRSTYSSVFRSIGAATPAIAAAVLLLCAAVRSPAMSLEARTDPGPDGVTLDVRTDAPPAQAVLRTLDSGMRAEIIFTIQVYRHPEGLIRLLGDRLVQEIRITREARWDALGEQYVVSSSLGPEVRTRSIDEFVRRFFGISNFVLPWSFLRADGNQGGSPSYMMVRLQVRPMKLVSALAILSFLHMEQEISSAWARIPIPDGVNTNGANADGAAGN
jgi:hypothetical protein